MQKRFLSLLMAALMVFSLFPFTAAAADDDPAETTVHTITFTNDAPDGYFNNDPECKTVTVSVPDGMYLRDVIPYPPYPNFPTNAFDFWVYWDSGRNEDYSMLGSGLMSLKPTRDMTIEASYRSGSNDYYMAEYHLNGGAFTDSSLSEPYRKEFLVGVDSGMSFPSAQREGYRLLGWSTSETWTEGDALYHSYDSGIPISRRNLNHYYAVWGEPCTHPEDQVDVLYAREATCTSDGATGEKFCNVCGETIEQSTVIPALGHDWSEWTVTQPAAPGADGVETRTCARCGETETRAIPAPVIVDSGTCGENLTWTLDADGVLTITGSGPMADFFGDSSPFYQNQESIRSVIIESGVTSIGYAAFAGCTVLTSAAIPETVTSIGGVAFNKCSSLTDVYYPGTVTQWNAISISYNNDALLNAARHYTGDHDDFGTCGENLIWTLDDGVLTISGTGPMALYSSSEESPFYACRDSIQSVVIEPGVTSVGNYAFYNCYNMASVTIPDGVTSIGDYAFYNCNGLTSVVIPEGVTSIGTYAFNYCSGLTEVTIPVSLAQLGYRAFDYCSALETVNYVGTISQWNAIQNDGNNQSLYNAARNYTGQYLDAGDCGANIKYTLSHEGVLTITGSGDVTDAPWPREYVQSIVFDGDVTSVCGSAFFGCTGLTEVVIPDSLSKISGSMFQGCTSLTAVTIPDSVTSIENYAFSGCSSLTSVVIPEGVTYIGQEAFYNCSRLESAVIPSTVTSISGWAFQGCTSLTDVTYLTDRGIGYCMFENCISLTSIALPEGCTSIDSNAFKGCTSLETVSVPESTSRLYVGEYAFADCVNLKDISVPCSVGSNSFANCSSLQHAAVIGNVYDRAFFGCTALEEVVVNNWTGYQSNNDVKISSYAFGNCPALTKIWLPDKLTMVEANAFRNDEALAEVYYDGTQTQWDAITIRESGNDPLLNAELLLAQCPHTETRLKDASAATCISSGYTGDRVCARCGELIEQGTSIPALGHNFVLKDSSEATCTEAGYQTFECTTCHTLRAVMTPALGHSWGDWTVTQPAAETEPGVETSECAVCHETRTREIPATMHDHLLTAVAAVPATCETDGSDACWQCGVCGQYFADADAQTAIAAPAAIPAFGHDWTEWVTIKEPTATEKGVAMRVCANDRTHVEFEALPTVADCPSKNFTDVDFNAYYHIPMDWAVVNGVTTGVTATTFEPNRSCTRAQVVTFLWRAAGSPEPTLKVNPFSDVSASAYYYKAVLWAVEQGITTGINNTHFAPDRTVTRGQVVTFLWRMQGEPEPTGGVTFPDVVSDSYYAKAVSWAAEQGITTGTNGLFNPQNDCTRAQIVTFLYRALAE